MTIYKKNTHKDKKQLNFKQKIIIYSYNHTTTAYTRRSIIDEMVYAIVNGALPQLS